MGKHGSEREAKSEMIKVWQNIFDLEKIQTVRHIVTRKLHHVTVSLIRK